MDKLYALGSSFRNALTKIRKGEMNKMRDVAFGPAFYIMSAVPILLVVLVIALVIFAAVKVANISAKRKEEEKRNEKDDL